ncbi:MAG: tripartite tricarboxylate transporter substrate binding protein [Burkholderiales bacterium]|nr:tripartite tricarboxylate transporter substrate binding protein [Burkholderiales bacterium]
MGKLASGIVLSLLLAPAVQAQSYPSKTVRIIVGFAAGGPSDIVARLLAQQLTERLGRTVIVDNRAGATGTIGADLVAKAPPDGHTLYLASQTTHAVAPYMYRNVGYDPVKDFATVTLAMQNPLLGVVHPSVRINSVKDLIAFARARPGELNFATGGQGSSPHMSMELLKSMAKIDMVPVHYKGDGAAIPEVIGGQVPLMFSSISAWLPHVNAGKVRGIAVTSMKRSSIAPQFPTIAESGLPGFEVITWFGILATAGTPREVILRLNDELVKALAVPAVKEQAAKLGMEIVGNSADEYAAFLRSENAKWGKMVKALQLKAD